MKTLLTGATGFIGTELVATLIIEGGEVRVLSRNSEKAKASLSGRLIKRGIPASQIETSLRTYDWDPDRETAPMAALEGVDSVIHLAGENIGAGRWTEERKRRILDSRKRGTRNLADAIRAMSRKPVFVSTSAVGFYGDRGDELLTEGSRGGSGFLAEVCRVWEEEAKAAEASRLVILRNGMVLGEGGALEKMLPIFKAGLGGRLGSGKQWMGWIHIQDLVALYTHALRDRNMSGVYNAVSPQPVRNSDFTKELAHALHRVAIFPAPAMALRLALGEMADEVLLASQRVEPARLNDAGFSFRFSTLGPALSDALE